MHYFVHCLTGQFTVPKKVLFLILLVFIIGNGVLHAQTRYWVAGVAASWSGDNWAASSGAAADGSGPPTALQNARFDGNGLGNCNVDVAVGISGLVLTNVYTGTIDLNGNGFTTSGTVTLSGGTINDTPGTSSFTVNSTGNTTFNGTTFGSDVDITSSNIALSGSTFNGVSNFAKNGSGSITGNGGNVFNDSTNLLHNGAGGNWVLGSGGVDDFNGYLTVTSTGSGTIYLAHTGSGSTFDNDVVISSSGSSGGIRFSSGNGSSTLGTGQTLTIGAGGFSVGNLELRNLTQTGATAQTLTLTGTCFLALYDASWGGDVSFSAPQISTRGSVYSGVTDLTKTGAGSNQSVGGNNFAGNTTITNTGSGYILMANTSPDTFALDLTVQNAGTQHTYIAYNSAGNYVGGNLLVTNTGSGGSNTYTYFTTLAGSSLTVDGTSTFTNSGSSSDCRIIAGGQGTTTLNDDVTFTNSASGAAGYIQVSDGASGLVTINGNTSATNGGASTTKRIYLGNAGDVTFNGTLDIINNSTATNSQVYANHSAASNNSYNGNITLQSTDAATDGIQFGNGGGSGTLGATFTISLAGPYVAGDLELRNFTQTGATAQSLTLTGTARIYCYDASWGGDVVFTAPRINTRGTTYFGTSSLTKNGATDDASVGGNIFTGNATLTNAGSRYFLLGNTAPDTFRNNLDIINSGTYHFYLAHNTAGTYVGGDFSYTQSASGTSAIGFLSNGVPATLTIDGNATLINNSSATTGTIYLGNSGDVTIGGDLSITNAASGTTGEVYFANGLDVTASVGGNTTVSNSGASNTKRVYLGNNGDVAFAGTISITNSSTATNSHVHCHSGANSSNTYGGNITVESTTANSIGVYFGLSGGSGVLAATRTISLSGGGFSTGTLYLRNFTQTGATAQNLALTGSGVLTIYDASWGGDVVFSAPQITTRGTDYSGTSSLTKNGAINDASAGGNTFTGNSTLTNTGSGYFMMGNGSPDTFSANLDMINSGSYHMYLGNNSAGNNVAGNLNVTHTITGTSGTMYLSNNSASTLTIGGDLTLINSGSATTSNAYIGSDGDVTIAGNLMGTNSPSGTTGILYIGNGTNSTVSIGGTSAITNSGSGTTKVTYVGQSGDITFGDLLTITNSASATSSQVYCNSAANSVNAYNGNIVLEVTNASNDGILFGNSNGSGTLAATRTITVGGGGFIAGDMYFRNFTQVGATTQTLTGTGTSYMRQISSNWGGDVTFAAPRINTTTTTYSGTANLTKTGATNDASVGGNTFTGNTTLTATGSGYLLMGNGTADTFGGNLDLFNSGTYNLYVAHSSPGNTVAGNVTISNNTSGGTNGLVYLSTGALSTLSIAGDVTVTNTGSAATSSVYLGSEGDISIGGDVVATNNPNGASGAIYVANGTNSTASIAGTSHFTNSGSGTTKTIYLGNNGDVTFGDSLVVTNNASATNSLVYLHSGANSVNVYNGNIVIEETHASGDGFQFGVSGGSGTLAATRTVTIGAGGFIAGDLYFRNFTQVGPTAQALAGTGTSYMRQINSNWGGDVVFSAPRMNTNTTTYSGTSSLTKTGATDDQSAGGNTFTGNAILANTGSGYFLMGSGSPDTFGANVDLLNSGTRHMYLAYNSAGNTIGGDLTVTNNPTGTSGVVYLSTTSTSTLSITGNVVLTNSGSTASCLGYIGSDGDVTIGGNLTATNSASGTTGQIIVANGTASTVTIGGVTRLSNGGAGTNKYIYLGNNGDITCSDSLYISNSASATNSQVYCNTSANSTNLYNESIVLESTNANCDGIIFGNGGGSATLVATRTVTVGAGGFIAGFMTFRNFTQVGATPQTLVGTGTAYMNQYDSDWGGNVVFEAPRMNTRGTNYSGTASLTKTGAINDASVGGNTFTGNATLVNTGSGYFLMGNGSADTFGANLDITNSGSNNFYIAHNSLGNTIAGNLSFSNTSSGTNTNCYISTNTASSLTVTGTTVITHAPTATTAAFYVGDQGDITFSDSLTIINGGSSTTNTVSIANNVNSTVSIVNDLVLSNTGSGTTHRVYAGNNGDVSFGGNLVLTNASSANTGEIYVGNGTNSSTTIAGNTIATNSGTGGATSRVYLGNSGDITFTGTLDLINSSTSNNSQIYCNSAANSSNIYNGNITVQVTNASSDGILFGASGGNGTLAATRTITVGGGGFIAGSLYFRNFTQTGATAQALTLTGTANMTQYDASWGGDVTFLAPQFTTRGTLYSGTTYLEKTGAVNNASVGGNTLTGNATLVNSGSGYFLMGNGNADTFGANLDITNSGSNNFYIAHSGAGHTIAGDLNFTNSASGGNTYLYICAAVSATLTVSGDATISNSTTSSNARVYIGDQGDIDFNGDLTLTNNTSGATAYFYLANNTNATVTVDGVTRVTNGGSSSAHQIYLGNVGDITFNDSLYITNNSTATNSQIYCNNNSASSNIYNGDIVIENTTASSDGIYFGNGAGTGILAAGQTMSIGSGGFVAGLLYFRNFTQTGATAQSMTLTGTGYMYHWNTTWGGDVAFVAPRMYTNSTQYSGTASLEKTGATNDPSPGGNTFDGDFTFTNSGTGYFMMANGTADDYNGDFNLIKTSTGLMYPNYNATCTYAGDINLNTNTAVTFGAAGNGIAEFDGTGAQSINDLAATVEPIFTRIVLDNSNSEVTLNTPITASTRVTFTQGNLITTDANLLTMNDNSTALTASDDSYVRGPIEKVGNDAFTFPVGDSGLYRPITITAPASGVSRFRATYQEVNPNPTYDWQSKDGSLEHVSTREYWTLDRSGTSNTVSVTLSWDTNSGGVDNLSELRVARWDGSAWRDHGNGGTTGNTTAGTVTSSSAVTSFSPFTLASSTTNNPLPIELLDFNALLNEDVVEVTWVTATETNNDYFTVERSADGENFEPIEFVDGAGNSSRAISYNLTDYEPLETISYYRLKQTDFDGTFTYSKLVAVDRTVSTDGNMSIYPNPNRGGTFNIELKGASGLQRLEVIDITGRVWHRVSCEFTDHAPNRITPEVALPLGTYFVRRINNEDEVTTTKMVVY